MTSTVNKYRIYCNTESSWIEGWGTTEPTVCYNNSGHTVNSNSVSLLETVTANPSVDFKGPMTPFGSLKTENLIPIAQYDFAYTIQDQLFDVTISGGATGCINNAKMEALTMGVSGDSATIQSKKIHKYRPGQGIIARFTSVFTLGVTGTEQIIGLFDENNGFAIGYDGADFGILHRNDSSGTIVDTWVHQAQWSKDTADGNAVLPGIDFCII